MFNVDDRFHGSDPVMRIPRADRLAAVGLWTLTGTWSAQFLKDGYVPLHVVEEYPDGVRLADLLVKPAGLWKRRGRLGYQFIDWERWQRTRKQVEEFRQAERDRKADWRARKAEKSGDGPDAVPTGQGRPSALPSPSSSSSPSPDEIDQSTGEVRPRAESKDGSVVPPGDRPVETARPDLDRILARLQEIAPDAELHLLHAAEVAHHFLDRAKGVPKMGTKYVLTCITNHLNTVENFLHTGRWSE